MVYLIKDNGKQILYGLSTDDKDASLDLVTTKTDVIVYCEVDTGKEYIYNTGEWYEQAGSGGGGGGQSEYTLIGSKEVTASTTSTTAIAVDTIQTDPSAYANVNDKLVYVRVRDKDGEREGHFFGIDSFFNHTEQTQPATITARFTGGILAYYTGYYGVYVSKLNSDGTATVSARYNVNYSSTIDGTYIVEIYLLNYPD